MHSTQGHEIRSSIKSEGFFKSALVFLAIIYEASWVFWKILDNIYNLIYISSTVQLAHLLGCWLNKTELFITDKCTRQPPLWMIRNIWPLVTWCTSELFIFHLKYLLFPSFSNWQLLTPFNIHVAEVCTEGEKKAPLPAGYRIDTHCF